MIPNAASLFSMLPRGLRRHKLIRLWMKLMREDPIQLVRINGTGEAYVDLSDGFMRLIIIDGDYDPEFFRVATALLTENAVFYDGGANFGLLSFGLVSQALTKDIQCHLFEPNPSLVKVINQSLSRHPNADIIVNDVAISNHDGTLPIRFDSTQSGASHFDPASPDLVRCVSLDNYSAQNQIEQIDLLKLDVEGHELAALEGCRRLLGENIIKAIYFEYFEKHLVRNHPPKDLLNFLISYGFSIYLCREHDLEQQGGPTHFYLGPSGVKLPLALIDPSNVPSQTDLLALPLGKVLSVVGQPLDVAMVDTVSAIPAMDGR